MQCKTRAYFALGALCSLVCCVLPALEVMPRAVLIPRRGGGRQESSNYTNQALFSCVEVLPDSRHHRPRTEVIWLKNGDFLNTQTRKYRNYGMKKRLLVRDIVEEDSGVYECAFSLNSTEKGRAELWIAPHIVDAPPIQHLASDSGKVVCRVSGGVREVQWRREGAVIASTTNSSGGSRYTVLADGSLGISGVAHLDRGMYECRVSNPAGQQTREIRVKVTRTTPSSAESSMPTESGSQVLTTPAPTTHTPTTHNTTDLPSAEPTAMSNCVEVGDISFHSAPPPPLSTLPTPSGPPVPLREGAQSSPAGQPSMKNLEVLYFTMVPPRCVRTTAGYNIVLHCSAAGSPSPVITWKKDTRPLNTTQTQLTTDNRIPHYSQLPNGSLQINTVQLADRGRYTCTAKSSVGQRSATVRVRVMGESDVCGLTAAGQAGAREKRVARGEVVSGVQEHPWQVLIEYSTSHGVEQLCGGALVRPDWVVTAAHCLFNSPRWRMPGELRLRVGVFNRSLSEASQQELEVRSYLVHPDYRHPSISASQEYDIALLKLQHPVKLSNTARLVCLPQRSQEPPVGTRCTVTGWGHLRFGGDWSPDVLHQAVVPLVSYSHCRSAQSYGSRITRNILCAGYQEGGQDACQNDSGGPLVCQSQGKWTLYGVVNYGEGCGAPHKYGLYARVMKYSEWINDVMRAHSW